MNWPLYLFIGLVAAMWIFQLYIVRRAKRAEGKSVPDTEAVDGGAHAMSRRLYYFYAPHCGPCRAMTPMVERLQSTHPNMIKVNIDESQALAKAFGIAATPSFVLVNEGVISQVILGAQSEQKLKRILETEN